MLGHQPLELGDELVVAAHSQIRLDTVLHRGDAELLQPGDLGLREGLEDDVGEGVAAPQPQRVAQRRRGLLRLGVVEQAPAVGHQPLE